MTERNPPVSDDAADEIALITSRTVIGRKRLPSPSCCPRLSPSRCGLSWRGC